MRAKSFKYLNNKRMTLFGNSAIIFSIKIIYRISNAHIVERVNISFRCFFQYINSYCINGLNLNMKNIHAFNNTIQTSFSIFFKHKKWEYIKVYDFYSMRNRSHTKYCIFFMFIIQSSLVDSNWPVHTKWVPINRVCYYPNS